MTELYLPTKVFFGAGAADSLVIPYGTSMIVHSASGEAVARALEARLQMSGAKVHLMRIQTGEPSSSMVNELRTRCPHGIEAVVGIGGGSVLDTAKALALLLVSGGAIEEYEFGERKVVGALPLYLVPTTAGSGSEVTPYCVINNTATKRKFTLTNVALRAAQAAVDPELLSTLSAKLMVPPALDAFTHCLEALLNRSRNTLVDPLAHEGLRIAYKELPRVAQGFNDSALRTNLATLSLYGGIAVAHNRTGLIHTLSVAFAEFVSLPHGLLNALLVPYALTHNLQSYRGRLAEVTSVMTGETIGDDHAAGEMLLTWLRPLVGGTTLVSRSSIEDRREHLVARVMQDKGLSAVSYGAINEHTLSATIDTIAHET